MRYLKDLGFEESVIELINKNFPEQAIETLTTEESTVTQNINYLKDLGVSNYYWFSILSFLLSLSLSLFDHVFFSSPLSIFFPRISF